MVPTVTYRLLFVLLVLAHNRRRVVHVAITEQPTSAWTAQQLRNAFPHEKTPSYLLHDRDSIFAGVATTLAAMQIQHVLTAPRSPWQNAAVPEVNGLHHRYDRVAPGTASSSRPLVLHTDPVSDAR